jgi:uncharacterized protein YeaO (DUF488 family)
MAVQIKRIYEAATPEDGYRVLVDRMWPRGISRRRAVLDGWERNLAPTDELREWYGHVPERFDEFARRYRSELGAHADVLRELRERSRAGTLTLVFSARDPAHSNAAVLADVLLNLDMN